MSEKQKWSAKAGVKASTAPAVQRLVDDILSGTGTFQLLRLPALPKAHIQSFAKSDEACDLVLSLAWALHTSAKSHCADASEDPATQTGQSTEDASSSHLSIEPEAQPAATPYALSPMTEPIPMPPSPIDPGAATTSPADIAPRDVVQPDAAEPAKQAEAESESLTAHGAQTHAYEVQTSTLEGQSPTPEQVPESSAPTTAAPAAVPTAPSPIQVSITKPATPSDRAAPSAPAIPAQVPQPRFVLANCKVGTEYTAKIEGRDSAGRELEVLDIVVPQGLGLGFDVATQSVTGVPTLAGDFVLPLQWRYPGHASRQTGECRLTSNPDPRSLWKVVEPDQALPYQKPHLAQQLIEGDGFRMVAASRRGRSHEHGGTFRDDDFFIASTQTNGWNVLIVADGAGSAEFSREGSRVAVQTAGCALVEELAGEFGAKVNGLLARWDADSANTFGNEFHYCFHRMATLAVQGIEQAANERGAPVRSYATTLLAAAIKRDGENAFLATFWMGDGAIAAYWSSGTVKLMGTPDGGEFAGQTRFLDRATLAEGFAKRVSIGRYGDLSAVILMTDGVSDPYFETDNGLADPAKWDALWQDIEPSLNSDDPAVALVDWLHFFRQGHHDDRTITLLW
ncbi:PP2C family serine/threonine-protein phosphatase [Burkholderia sp. 8Y]|uniref:PP2C family serine/threonine-protein phosphatase n=1 Tax=Burkholderia sp. 8Y TaxID=2653133 RepID=UPI001915C4A6|nr:PP2C family serine/threonine-protein phosphatase [Burkholderia sp. 8Y]